METVWTVVNSGGAGFYSPPPNKNAFHRILSQPFAMVGNNKDENHLIRKAFRKKPAPARVLEQLQNVLLIE